MMRADIFEEREGWTGPVAMSVGFHLLLAATIFLVAHLGIASGPNWGGDSAGGPTGDAMSATLVSSAGVPLPQPQTPTENIVATENKGLTQSVPQAVIEDKSAVPIPDKETKHRIDRIPSLPAHNRPQPITTPPNVIAYGEGGPVSR